MLLAPFLKQQVSFLADFFLERERVSEAECAFVFSRTTSLENNCPQRSPDTSLQGPGKPTIRGHLPGFSSGSEVRGRLSLQTRRQPQKKFVSIPWRKIRERGIPFFRHLELLGASLERLQEEGWLGWRDRRVGMKGDRAQVEGGTWRGGMMMALERTLSWCHLNRWLIPLRKEKNRWDEGGCNLGRDPGSSTPHSCGTFKWNLHRIISCVSLCKPPT